MVVVAAGVAMPSAEEARAAAEAWLGGEHGGRKLPDLVVAALLAGFDNDDDPVWTFEDVPDGTRPATSELKIWSKYLKESAEISETTIKDSHATRFEVWLAAHYETGAHHRQALVAEGYAEPWWAGGGWSLV